MLYDEDGNDAQISGKPGIKNYPGPVYAAGGSILSGGTVQWVGQVGQITTPPSAPPTPRQRNSDIVVTKDHRIFIDGHEVRGVYQFDANNDGYKTEVMMQIVPGSIIYGDPPTSTVEAMHEQGLSDPGETVDIEKAIQRARARQQGGTP